MTGGKARKDLVRGALRMAIGVRREVGASHTGAIVVFELAKAWSVRGNRRQRLVHCLVAHNRDLRDSGARQQRLRTRSQKHRLKNQCGDPQVSLCTSTKSRSASTNRLVAAGGRARNSMSSEVPFCSVSGWGRYRLGISLMGENLCLRPRSRVVREGRTLPLLGMSVKESRC